MDLSVAYLPTHQAMLIPIILFFSICNCAYQTVEYMYIIHTHTHKYMHIICNQKTNNPKHTHTQAAFFSIRSSLGLFLHLHLHIFQAHSFLDHFRRPYIYMKNIFNNNSTTSTGTMSRRSTTISTAQTKSTVNSDAQPSSSSSATNLQTPTASQIKKTDDSVSVTGTNESTSSNNASIIVLRSGSNTKILKKQASDVLCRLKKRPLMGNSNSNYMTDADLNAELTW
jgi:hypothetical protein